MAWIESHQGLLDHRKTIMAAAILGIPEIYLIGHLHGLWYKVLDHAEDGDLKGIPNVVIATWARYTGDADHFCEVLRSCGREEAGFLDGEPLTFRIHDWWDFAGKLIARRHKDKQRKRQESLIPQETVNHPRENGVRPAEFPRKSHGIHEDSRTNHDHDRNQNHDRNQEPGETPPPPSGVAPAAPPRDGGSSAQDDAQSTPERPDPPADRKVPKREKPGRDPLVVELHDLFRQKGCLGTRQERADKWVRLNKPDEQTREQIRRGARQMFEVLTPQEYSYHNLGAFFEGEQWRRYQDPPLRLITSPRPTDRATGANMRQLTEHLRERGM